ncbi:cytochrome c oxidase subunit 4 [Gulosibacter sp. 10]|uniref:aa3-type cytochrome oxidase subunit IV n=1 Tax=Gulosibacter sp. 10 TaxID=1255570 RepID=UPI00097F0E92|nr:cytochrome c oxidase subunit 4 [Gulosibacter sp. 10]SJM65666.1 Possible conserved integral membrane protein precursor [Gulosibacter sp. 10]
MRTTRNILWGLTVFYALMAVIYSAWTGFIEKELEWVGAVAFVLMTLFTAFIAWYLGLENKPFSRKPLPEDRENAEIADADEDLGFFMPSSMWPVVTAAGVGLVFASIAVGWWPAFWFAPAAIVGLLGWMFETYRGKFGH